MMHFTYSLILGSSKSIGLELANTLLKNKNNIVIGISRSKINIRNKNFIQINCDLLTFNSYIKIINILKKKGIPYINNLLVSLRDRSGKKNNIENEFKILIFNPIKFFKKLNDNGFIKKDKINSTVFIGSALDSSLSSFANKNYLLPRQSLKYLIEDLAYEYKDVNLRFFCLAPFIFIKKENMKLLNYKNDLVKNINNLSNYKIIKSKDIVEIILFLFSKKSILLNGQTINIDGNVLKRLK